MDNLIDYLFGTISFLAIIAGFLTKEYQLLFWSVGSALLIIMVLGRYVFSHEEKIDVLLAKLKKIEEDLNIHNRLNKLELKVFKK